MILLTRTVRFSINPSRDRVEGRNGYGGVASMSGLGCHYELDVACRGEPDPVTGYLINIKEIDVAARTAAVPIIAEACRSRPETEPGIVLAELMTPLNDALNGRLTQVRWKLSRSYSVEMERSAMNSVVMRQQFEFAASHRLHASAMSAEENKRCFGKCNSPNGHGHNYIVEPAVVVDLGKDAQFTLQQLESLVEETVIKRFDHKHLNKDTTEFGPDGVNPSVEHIARICFELLSDAIHGAGDGVTLRAVTVWETDRTSCTYPADDR